MFNKKFKLSSAKKQPAAEGEKSKENEEKTKSTISPLKSVFIKSVGNAVHNSSDLKVKSIHPNLTLIYIDNLVDGEVLKKHIIHDLLGNTSESPENVLSVLSIPNAKLSGEIDGAITGMMDGTVLIHVEGYSQIVLANIPTKESRALSTPENESQVIGSQVGFNESLTTNISLVRRYIKNPDLCNEEIKVGERSNTAVSMLYIKGIASEEMINMLRQRITDIKIDSLLDSSILEQLIDDNSLSIFPQMLLTERPDKLCSELLNGKLGVIVDGSTMAIVAPHSFLEFFQSQEDINLRWQIATFARLLRFSAVVLSIFLTPLYVAALTFHYEVIPQTLLVTLSESRSLVPFPPLFEALLLELIIELLREAGIRLPSKVGQTIGIVGGIVIGTAAVQAGITSNILIIIVALGALASFTTPSYMMGNVIRIIRFPLILLAGYWGFYGIMFGFCFIIIHLLRQTSLGSPYTAPFYPPRVKDWRDSIIRMPLPFTFKRPSNTRPEDEDKYEPGPVNPEKNEQKVE
ncbi:spore germination protein [Filibacter tadaridae]|uniref:Spore germination protein A1 n=1 Tax=Filibacter tadaridae TaxID=2483811 RepID=A0A3P5XCX9_9BACL|nr:spore germination protein [Filibacter tadaridae]VDC28088.1 Spore germination protein A1 [Filibacter tadaridae]